MLFVVTFYKSLQKGNFCLSLIFGMWVFTSFLAIFYYLNPFLQDNIRLTIPPYIFLFSFLLIATIPFRKYNGDSISRQQLVCNGAIFKVVIFLITICSYEPFLEILVKIFTQGTSTLGDNYSQLTSGMTTTRSHFSLVGKYLYSVTEYLQFVSIPFFFLYLSSSIRKKKIVVIGLLLGILCPVMNNFANGQRFASMICATTFFFNYLLFFDKLNDVIRKNIRKFGILALTCFGILIVAISITRFGAKSDYDQQYGTAYQFLRYFGESTVRFNSDAWNTTYFMHGERFFKNILIYFNMYSGLDIEDMNKLFGFVANDFYTVVGDLYIDFGFSSIIFVGLISLFLYKLYNNKLSYLKFGTIILLNLWANLWMFGICYNVYANGMIHSLWAIILAIVINLITTSHDVIVQRKY